MTEQKHYYIGVTQNGIAKLNKDTNENILGLYTDELKICLGIALYGIEGQISLIHHDGTVDFEQIKQEFEKFSILKWEIWRNSSDEWEKNEDENLNSKTHSTNFALSAGKWTNIEPEFKETKTGCVWINRDGSGYSEKPKNSKIEYIRDKELRHTINMLNHLFKNEDIDEQYDGSNWAKPNKLKEKEQQLSLTNLESLFNLWNLSTSEIDKRTALQCKYAELVREYNELDQNNTNTHNEPDLLERYKAQELTGSTNDESYTW